MIAQILLMKGDLSVTIVTVTWASASWMLHLIPFFLSLFLLSSSIHFTPARSLAATRHSLFLCFYHFSFFPQPKKVKRNHERARREKPVVNVTSSLSHFNRSLTIGNGTKCDCFALATVALCFALLFLFGQCSFLALSFSRPPCNRQEREKKSPVCDTCNQSYRLVV